LTTQAPVIFVQYIAAMAVVEGIKSYDTGYRGVPVKLKWPNDICEFSLKCNVLTLIKYFVKTLRIPRSLARNPM